MSKSDWLNTVEVAKRLGVSSVTVRRWTDSGRLECTKTAGGHRRYRESTIDSFQQHNNSDANHSSELSGDSVQAPIGSEFYGQVNMANTVLRLNLSIEKALGSIEDELERVNEVITSTADIADIGEVLPDPKREKLENHIGTVVTSLQYHDLLTQRLGVVKSSLDGINSVFRMTLSQLNDEQRDKFVDELKNTNAAIDQSVLSNFMNNLLCDDKPRLDIIENVNPVNRGPELF